MQNVDERTPEKLPRQNSINLARKKCTGHISKINISQQLNIQFPSVHTKDALNSILIIWGLDVVEIARSDFEIDCRTPGRSFFQPVRYVYVIFVSARLRGQPDARIAGNEYKNRAQLQPVILLSATKTLPITRVLETPLWLWAPLKLLLPLLLSLLLWGSFSFKQKKQLFGKCVT